MGVESAPAQLLAAGLLRLRLRRRGGRTGWIRGKGPCGLLGQQHERGVKQHHLVWSPVHSTLRQVFPAVRAYNQAVYSFMDEWGSW